jgi:hypothetical protein
MNLLLLTINDGYQGYPFNRQKTRACAQRNVVPLSVTHHGIPLSEEHRRKVSEDNEKKFYRKSTKEKSVKVKKEGTHPKNPVGR